MRRSAAVLFVLVIAVALGAACSKAISDDAIATQVKAKMFSDPQVKSANIGVTVKQGEVTLAGEVPSDAARYQAFKLAAETPGVKKVNDQMTVAVAQAAPQPIPEPTPAPAPAPVRKAVKRAPLPPVRQDAPPPPPAPAESVAAPPPAPVAPPPPQPVQVEVPSGTTLSVRMIDGIDSQINHTGEIFHASLDAPIVIDNEVIVPKGADMYVKLVEARSAGHMTGRSELRLELVRMDFQGKSYTIQSNLYEQAGSSRGKRTAATVGGGAALGALIGAVAGGGKGAAIGAAVGAGSGTVVQAATKGQQVRVPSETKLDFRLEQPLEITYLPQKNRSNR